MPLESLPPLQFTWTDSIHNIPQAAWNQLAKPLAYPFLEWEWLAAMEDSEVVVAKKGWLPSHLMVYRGSELVGAAALYLKGHSRGEFVFDQEWAKAAQSMGLRYYPKLLGMSPFTPAPGYQFLLAASEQPRLLCGAMLAEIDEFCLGHGIFGCHFLHTDPTWAALMVEAGLSAWLHHHLVWENPGFANFEGYLGSFNSKQRKNIKRERRLVAEQAIEVQVVSGTEAGPELFQQMYAFYADTCQKFWNWSHYLNEAFFLQLERTFAHRIQLVTVRDASQEPVAMSFLIHKGQQLYGRYWGSETQFDQLHFEACYYRPIEWAIDNKVRFFDAGSGNARHKQKRGFPARPNQSLHRFYQLQFQELWDKHIHIFNQAEMEEIEIINREAQSPQNMCENEERER